MTDLVAEAIALCEIVEAVLTEKVNNPLPYTTRKPHIDEIVRVNAQNSQDATNLRFVKAHLAEFEWMKLMTPLACNCRQNGEGKDCFHNGSRDYYLGLLETKAKRLLGKE